MRKFIIFLSVISFLIISGCVTSPKVDVVQSGDSDLTCNQIQAEIQEADKFKKMAEDNKGITWSKVLSGGIIGTIIGDNQAIRLAEERKIHLFKLHNDKGCGSQAERVDRSDQCDLGFGCLRHQ